MTCRQKALAYGAGTVLIWSTVATAFKITLAHMDPLQLLLCACTVSVVVLGATLVIQGNLGKLVMSAKQYGYCALLGALNPFLYYAVLFKAYDLLPAQEAQPLNFTWAITLSLLSVPLLGQRLNKKELGAILISYMGVLIISTHGNLTGLHFSNGLGVILALVSTIIWALYWIGNTRSQCDPVAGLFLNFLFGLPLVFLATIIFSKLPIPDTPALLGSLYIGLFEMGISFVLWLTALRLAALPEGGGTARIANLIFLSPFLSLFFISHFAGEAIQTTTFIGLGFIVAGNILMQRAGNH